MRKQLPALVIHGGAGSRVMTADQVKTLQLSMRRILELSYPLLESGRSAVEAVAYATELLENDPLYNAGKGSKIQSDGHIRMSASIMDGVNRRFAACVNVEGLKNPVRLAQALLSETDRTLAGVGARKKAKELGLKFASPFTPYARQEFAEKKKGLTGTVGAVALDLDGHLAAATSTGGRGFEYPHRVSDSPTAAGNFANLWCAVSATGIGEQIVEHSVASRLCILAESGVPVEKASRNLVSIARKSDAKFGWIAIDRNGVVSTGNSTRYIIWASCVRGQISTFQFRV